MSNIPDCPVDMFSAESVRNAREVDDSIREAGPVLRLEDGTVIITRYDEVAAGLTNAEVFSSKSRPWHDPSSVRPEILLTDDAPRHTQVRPIIANALAPRVLEAMREGFNAYARDLMKQALESDGIVDVVAQFCQPFVHKVMPDLLGMAPEGREHISAFGHMVWATLGPQNELFDEAMQDLEELAAWADQVSRRDRLVPGSLGDKMYQAADEGRITQEEARLLVLTILSAGADTTILTTAALIGAFARFPEQYERAKADPKLRKNAFDESIRWDSPSRMAGRIVAKPVQVAGYDIPVGQRVGLLFAAANRDPRAWDQPDLFDVGRDVRRHIGFGYGIHACVGRTLAQYEVAAMLNAFIEHVDSVEMAGTPEPWMTTIGHGPVSMPVRLVSR